MERSHGLWSLTRIGAGSYQAGRYMLLHGNQAHALSNLQSILVAGPAATDTLGVNGAMVTYVAAGVAAALDPFEFGTQRLERIVERWGVGERVRRVFNLSGASEVVGERLGDKLSKAFDEARKSAVRAVAKKVQENVRSIGASAGVSAVAVRNCRVPRSPTARCGNQLCGSLGPCTQSLVFHASVLHAAS